LARRRKRRKRGGGLFKPPKHKDLARIVTFESVKDAEKAAKRLKELFRKTRNCKRKLIIYKATMYAANRAKAGAKNPKFSIATKRKWRKVSRIYAQAAKWMQKRYAKACKIR